MLTAQEIRSVTFEKAMRGYKVEDVNALLAQVSATVERLEADKAEAEKKVMVLAQKVEDYIAQEESIKSALLNAQRLGDNMIYEAKQKGDSILNEATTKAKKMIDITQEREREAKENLVILEDEVAAFKANILGLYQQHIEALTQIDGQVNAVHSAVFGTEKFVDAEKEDLQDTPSFHDEQEDSVIDNAGNIVDSFQAEEE